MREGVGSGGRGELEMLQEPFSKHFCERLHLSNIFSKTECIKLNIPDMLELVRPMYNNDFNRIPAEFKDDFLQTPVQNCCGNCVYLEEPYVCRYVDDVFIFLVQILLVPQLLFLSYLPL